MKNTSTNSCSCLEFLVGLAVGFLITILAMCLAIYL
jgi:hypothetical protein